MSDMIVTTGVPEVVVGQTAPAASSPEVKFSGAWGDMAQDMAALEKELTPAQPAHNQAPAAATETPKETVAAQPPAPVAPAVPAVEVPEKFRDASGKLDQEKLIKSYLEAEKGFKRLQNAQQAPAPAPVAPQGQPQAPLAPVNLTPFERQVAQDLINEAAAVGYAMPEGQAIAQARVQIRLEEARHKATTAATFAKVDAFESELAERKSREQLDALKQDNPWVLSPEGFRDITAILEEKPWLKQSPTPYADAVDVLLGRRSKNSQGQVQIPTPTAAQQGIPLPVTAAPVNAAPVVLNSQEDILAHVKTLTQEQEDAFWVKAGMKPIAVSRQFKGR